MENTNRYYELSQLFDRKMMSLLWGNTKIDKAERDKLKLLYDSKKKKATDVVSCSTNALYKLSNTTIGRMGYGRYYSSPMGLERLEKQIRGTLCRGLYDDVDIVNCHPTLIVQYAKEHHHLEMPHLTHYTMNREAVFALLKKEFYLSKEEVKIYLLKIMYGGLPPTLFDYEPFLKNIDVAPKLFEDIKHEIDILVQCIIVKGDHADLHSTLKKDKGKNLNGRFLSLLIQREERMCLDAMIKSFMEKGLSPDVLAYDGCMIRGVGSATPEILAHAEKAVFDATGYTIKLLVKPQDYFEDSALIATREKDEDEYQAMKTKWERDHFYCQPSNTICEVKLCKINHYDLAHATEAFNGWTIKEDEKTILFLEKWRKDASRRIVENFVNKMPEDCAPNECSLFKGFAYQQLQVEISKEEQLQYTTLWNDLLGAVCNDEAVQMAYVERYFAHALQRPFERPDVALIFCSHQQGTGKDTVVMILKRIIGEGHFAHYTAVEEYWEKFDPQKEGAIIQYMEEGEDNFSKGRIGAYKARITSPTTNINLKGKNPYTIPNFSRQIMTTQKPNSIKIEDTDRRSNLIMCSPRLRTADWVTIQRMVRDPKFLYTIATHLTSISLDGWDSHKFPESGFKTQVKELTMSSEKAFLEQYRDGDWVGATDLFNKYRAYCTEHGLYSKQTAPAFGIAVMPYLESLIEKKIDSGKRVTYRTPQFLL